MLLCWRWAFVLRFPTVLIVDYTWIRKNRTTKIASHHILAWMFYSVTAYRELIKLLLDDADDVSL